jgi:hypothetical protein
MPGTVFILGAGFSRNAGMPLVQHLREEVFEWLKANADDPRVSVHMKPLANWPEYPNGKFWDPLRLVDPHDKLGFEEWMIGLRRLEAEEPACVQAFEVLRHACVQLLWAKQIGMATLPQSYHRFARLVRNELGVISFNWELVCELALEAEQVPWGYSVRTAPIPVIKPHGSLNWTNNLMQKDWGRTIQNPHGFLPISPEATISYMPDQRFEDPLLTDSDDLRCVIFPGCEDLLNHKAGACASAEKERLWNEAVSLIGRANCVAFIGYSLPIYDLEALERLEYACRGKEVIVCNPDDEVIQRFRQTFGRSHIMPEPHRFEESRFGVEQL